MGAKKLEPKMTSDKVWLADAIKDGRAVEVVGGLSMKAIGTPDIRLQQRVKHLNPNHVYELDQIRIARGRLDPIVVFEEQKPHRFHVADGHHRHEVYRIAKEESIPALVIQGTFRDALFYSTMCNQGMNLGRTKEDIKKAVFALLEDKEAFRWSSHRIADHVGNCTPPTVVKYRAEFCDLKKIAQPTVVEASDGRKVPAKNLVNGQPTIGKDPQGRMSIRIDGDRVHLGKDPLVAKQKVSTLLETQTERRRSLKGSVMQDAFTRMSLWFAASNLNSHLALGSIYYGQGVVWTSAAFGCQAGGGASTTDLHIAHASIRLARNLIDPTARAVVICYHEDAHPELLAAARADGVEYLTPEELVESIKGQGK